jgi:two-component system sensor histidine kinase KdpD
VEQCRIVLYAPDGHEVPLSSDGVTPGWPLLTAISVPLTVAGQPVGRLLVGAKRTGGALTPEEEQLLRAVAEQLATGVQRAHLQETATQAEVLRRTDALRAALLSAVSHDLRSPLGAIKTAATSLLSTRVSWNKADRRALLTTIVEQVEHINRLIGNLLVMGRIEAGKLRPQKEPAAIEQLIVRVVERLEGQLADHPVTLAVPPDLPLVPLDVVEIDEVLTNLLENAVKYTPAGTPIAVRVERRGDVIAVQVADQGPGIPAAHLPFLFDRYYRVQTGVKGGTGLGLAIAKGVVEAHGGQITVASTPGPGTTFTFTLPLSPSPGKDPAPITAGAGERS